MVKPLEPSAHEVWLGVGLRVEAASPREAHQQALAWLKATLEAAPTQDGIKITTPATDLAEPVVRAIQQMAAEQQARDTSPHSHTGE